MVCYLLEMSNTCSRAFFIPLPVVGFFCLLNPFMRLTQNVPGFLFNCNRYNILLKKIEWKRRYFTYYHNVVIIFLLLYDKRHFISTVILYFSSYRYFTYCYSKYRLFVYLSRFLYNKKTNKSHWGFGITINKINLVAFQLATKNKAFIEKNRKKLSFLYDGYASILNRMDSPKNWCSRLIRLDVNFRWERIDISIFLEFLELDYVLYRCKVWSSRILAAILENVLM